MSSIEKIFKEDPLWQEAKRKASNIKTETILSKYEFLKAIGHKDFSEEKYQNYLRSMKNERGQQQPFPGLSD